VNVAPQSIAVHAQPAAVLQVAASVMAAVAQSAPLLEMHCTATLAAQVALIAAAQVVVSR
jgi:hypothetical protein